MRNPRLKTLTATDPPQAFPPVEAASEEPDGLLAVGGDLSPERLLYAYRHGIFPWYDDGQPILWWSPNPRCILRPGEFHVSRRLRRTLSSADFGVSFNRSFDDVVDACAAARPGQLGTWITDEMATAYKNLRRLGWANSVEIWQQSRLVGGLYGIGIGQAFFGESMFSRVTDASKAAMFVLTRLLSQHGFRLLDCQVASPHLLTLGATLIPRDEFIRLLEGACSTNRQCRFWPTETRSVAEILLS